MSLNDTPSANRTHIAFFGRRNAGKSSLVNAISNQELAVVSEIAGTTTDPVYKSMELLPMGPVVLIDTAGIDDTGVLGTLRIQKTRQVLNKTDIAVLVVDASAGVQSYDKELIELFTEKSIKYIIAYNKCELMNNIPEGSNNEIYVSAKKKINIDKLKNKIAGLRNTEPEIHMVADFIDSGDVVVYVTPIDESAPKGRIILPQQQAIRDTLDKGAISVVVQPGELEQTLKLLGDKIKLVVTDSQVFGQVSKVVPPQIPLTSFSILVARVKGLLVSAIGGAAALDNLEDGSRVLISEGCTHHRQCNDIGTVKLPKLITQYTGKNLNFEFTSGGEFPEELSGYALIVHCGGCMINEREMAYRVREANSQKVPITNYGIAIAHMNGILKRSLQILPHLASLL